MPQDPNKIFPLIRVHSNAENVADKSYKLLGIFFDEYLSFDKQIETICAKLTRANYIIRKVSNKLSLRSLKNLYYALFHPHLLYCNLIFSSTSVSNLKRITILQNKVIRIINEANYNDHCAPLFRSSLILPFEQLLLYCKLSFMHSIYYSYAPQTFSGYFVTRADRNINYNLRDTDCYVLPTVRIELFRRFPLYNFPLIWNSAGDITFQPNRFTFQTALKEQLFDSLE